MIESAAAANSGDLCTECGLCCNGALFDYAELAGDQVAHARQLNLKVLRNGEKFGYGFPCPQLDGAVCRVYDKRPEVCRNFRCKTLREYEAGDIDVGEGMERIRAARNALSETYKQLPDGTTLTEARRWRRQAGEAAAGETLNASPILMMALGMLDVVLDEHFRRPEQRRVLPIE
ncbi:MAG: YkgJ family cysteine cluster protein [Pseudomonadota bacterium]